MDLGLAGRTALVMGASSGLGLASAEALCEEGARVVMFARREELLREHAERLDATPVAGDAQDHDAIRRAVAVAAETYGGLDVLVLNGGGPPAGAALDVTDEAIVGAVDLLLRPMVAAVRAALPQLRASDQGRIISIASTSVREPIGNLALSNAVRPGVWGYLKTLADELAPDGITVNSVGPGRIATARTIELFGDPAPPDQLAAIAMGRYGTPRELGDVVCFLASRQAGYLTGTFVRVDGGLSRAL